MEGAAHLTAAADSSPAAKSPAETDAAAPVPCPDRRPDPQCPQQGRRQAIGSRAGSIKAGRPLARRGPGPAQAWWDR